MNRVFVLALSFTLCSSSFSFGWTPLRNNEENINRWLVQPQLLSQLQSSNAWQQERFNLAVNSAADQWNSTLSTLQIRIHNPRSIYIPASCRTPDTLNVVVGEADLCGGSWPPGALAVALTLTNSEGAIVDSDIVFNANLSWELYPGSPNYVQAITNTFDFHRVALHELGHLIGLGHPDQAGQNVRSVMNSRYDRYVSSLQDDDVSGIKALYGKLGATTKASLENPGNNQIKSGVGVISGWACEATNVSLVVRSSNSGEIFTYWMEYGTPRIDTISVCGDSDNGFVTLVNYGNLGDGVHEVRLYVDNRLISETSFTTVTLGEAFVRGLSGAWSIPNFPGSGETTYIRWDQAIQNMTIFDVE